MTADTNGNHDDSAYVPQTIDDVMLPCSDETSSTLCNPRFVEDSSAALANVAVNSKLADQFISNPLPIEVTQSKTKSQKAKYNTTFPSVSSSGFKVTTVDGLLKASMSNSEPSRQSTKEKEAQR